MSSQFFVKRHVLHSACTSVLLDRSFFGIITGAKNTNQANFDVCRSSFFDLPSITLFKTLGPIEQVCIPPYQPSLGNPIVCGGTSGHYDNNLACIAVYYLHRLNLPLLTAFHIQASNSRPLQPPPNVNRRTCMNYSGGWKYVALRVNGISPVKCPIRKGDWNFRIGTFSNQYNRGHLVPCKLGKQISMAMAAATFNIFNVGPQHVDVNQRLAQFEDLITAFATEKCLRKDVIEGNVVQDFFRLRHFAIYRTRTQ